MTLTNVGACRADVSSWCYATYIQIYVYMYKNGHVHISSELLLNNVQIPVEIFVFPAHSRHPEPSLVAHTCCGRPSLS